MDPESTLRVLLSSPLPFVSLCLVEYKTRNFINDLTGFFLPPLETTVLMMVQSPKIFPFRLLTLPHPHMVLPFIIQYPERKLERTNGFSASLCACF